MATIVATLTRLNVKGGDSFETSIRILCRGDLCVFNGVHFHGDHLGERNGP